MAQSTQSLTEHPPSALRRLKIFVLILVVSNLFLGCLSVYLLRSLDDSYTELIDHHFPLMDKLRQLTKETDAMQRHVLGSLVNEDTERWNNSLQKLAESTANQRKKLGEILRMDEIQSRPKLHDALLASSKAYETGLVDFANLRRSAGKTEANKFRYDILRPAVNHYLDVIDEVATVVAENNQRISDDNTVRTRTHSTILLGLASWPLMIGLILVVVVGLIIGVLVLVYRQIGTEQY